MVRTSERRGTWRSVVLPSPSSAAHWMSSAAFLAPLMRISPSRRSPPWMTMLSMLVLSLALAAG